MMKYFTCLFLLLHALVAYTQDSSYVKLINEVSLKQAIFKQKYTEADSLKKDSIIHEAQKYIFDKIIIDYFRQWYGTPWDFNGTTRIPKKGKIACGYFVTTVLLDAGFKIPRIKWAQLPSETFIKKISTNTKRIYNKPVEDVISILNIKGDGLYIVGLDTHVGFLYKNGEVMQFVHSNYYEKEIGVMSQNINVDSPLKNSSYRFIGKILEKDMMIKWIMNEEFLQ